MKAARAAERLWSKIVRDPVTGCWLWTGAAMPTGHGISGNTTAYRVMYELIVEPIPEGLELDHLCRVPACVNPAHLEPVTHAENQRRMKYLHRGSHCRRGHPLAPPNIIAAKDGGHRCKTCRNINARAKRAARRTAMSVDDLLRPRPVFDSFGRYKLRLPGDAKPRGRTRVTTMIRALDQGDRLIAWKATATMVGALRNPGLMAKWAAIYAQSTDPWYANDDLKKQCKKLVDECADHGGAQSRADLGAALHTMVELVAQGEQPELVSPFREDIEAWINTLEAADLAPLPNWTEVCVYIEKYDLVGTFDGLFDYRVGEGTILGDLKTETSTDYKALAHAAQLAAYSLATHRIIWPANPEDEATLEPLPDFDRQTGLIIHLPAGEARCTLHAVDLEQGRHALELAAAMRKLDAQRKRKDTGGLMRPWTDLAPAVTPLSGAREAGTGGAHPPVPAPTVAAGAALGKVTPAATPTEETPCPGNPSTRTASPSGSDGSNDTTRSPSTDSTEPTPTTELTARLNSLKRHNPTVTRQIVDHWPYPGIRASDLNRYEQTTVHELIDQLLKEEQHA